MYEERTLTRAVVSATDPKSIAYFIRRWGPFTILSAFFFQVTAATFSSLGVALPHMISDLGWSWSQAGLGFSMLAFMVGIAAMVPTWLIRKWGVKSTFATGGLSLIIGLSLLAVADSLYLYFIGASLAGFGYPLCGMVPSIHYLNSTVRPIHRSAMIGAYLTVGGLGGVAGPLYVTAIMEAFGEWRYHWWLMVAITVLLTVLAMLFIDDKDQKANEKTDAEVGKAPEREADGVYQWKYRDVLRTSQYYVIVAAMTLTLFCNLTMSSWAVTHMNNLGVTGAIAAGALSGHALINSIARGFGGALANWIDAKWLLVSALGAEFIGMIALTFANDPVTIAIFALCEGYGFGMCLFATTVLLVNYYGTSSNPEVLGFMHLMTTLAMIGPYAAGSIAEITGDFGIVFIGYALLLFVSFASSIFMKKPVPPVSAQDEPSG